MRIDDRPDLWQGALAKRTKHFVHALSYQGDVIVNVDLAEVYGSLVAFLFTKNSAAKRFENIVTVLVGQRFAPLAASPEGFRGCQSGSRTMANYVYVPPAQALPSGVWGKIGQFDLGRMHPAASKV